MPAIERRFSVPAPKTQTDKALGMLKHQMQELEESKTDIKKNPTKNASARMGKVKLPFEKYQKRCVQRIAELDKQMS